MNMSINQAFKYALYFRNRYNKTVIISIDTEQIFDLLVQHCIELKNKQKNNLILKIIPFDKYKEKTGIIVLNKNIIQFISIDNFVGEFEIIGIDVETEFKMGINSQKDNSDSIIESPKRFGISFYEECIFDEKTIPQEYFPIISNESNNIIEKAKLQNKNFIEKEFKKIIAEFSINK